MEAVGMEGIDITVGLVGGRRLREQLLARFLELNGFRIEICAVKNLADNPVRSDGAIDVVIIDTGDHSCRDPAIAMIFACLRDVLPAIPVVVISDREDWSAVLDGLDLGVRAYCPYNLEPDILVEALRFVHRGGTFVPHHLVIGASVHRGRTESAERRQGGSRGLSPGEQRVLEWLRRGQSNKVIARELKIAESMVKVHVRRIMKKLNAHNRTEAALLAQQMVG
jgi:DNA-binding NarL/FixJ family response regulator